MRKTIKLHTLLPFDAFLGGFTWLPIDKKASSFPSKNLRKYCSSHRVVAEWNLIHVNDFGFTWLKSCLCFQHGNSYLPPNDGFCQRFITSEEAFNLKLLFWQVNVKYRNASSIAVLSRLSEVVTMCKQIFIVYVCSGESILLLTLDPDWNLLQGFSFLFYL